MLGVVGGSELSPSGTKIDSPDQLTNFISLQPKSESNFLSKAPRCTEARCLLEGSVVSSICAAGKTNVQMKMSMEHRWNDTERVKPKYQEKNLSQCHFDHQ